MHIRGRVRNLSSLNYEAGFLTDLKRVYSVDLEAVPPYNFDLTVHKPAGWWWSTPTEVYGEHTLWTATRFRGRLIGLKLESTGTLMKPKVRCSIFSEKAADGLEKREIARMLRRALRMDEDIAEFYELAKKDEILRDVIQDLCGMHTPAWPELFPALILAVTLQMAPMKRSNKMMDLLIDQFGEDACFDGKKVRYWPSPEKISASAADDLKTKAKLGYRAQSLFSIASTLKTGFPTMDELYGMIPEEAKKKLMTLRGIGEYSAEIIMPRMGFPLDVWSAKIFHILFFGKETESPREKIPELKKMAEKRWGKWRGHAFVYVLNDLAGISKRLGNDLTRF
jgi:DNA-3-methyladenine glycosylase II